MTGKNGSRPVRLSLTMVVRDCADTLEPLLKAMSPHVQEIIIVLGGASRDRTPKIAKKFAHVVIDYDKVSDVPWDTRKDWAAARNMALKHVTGEFWMWLDGDDAIEHPERLPRIMDYMNREGLGRCDLTYQYQFDEHGNPTVVHQRERIMRTALGWRWEDRVHETAHTDAEHVIGFSDAIEVIHKRTGGGASERNLPILLEMLAEEPKPRTLLHVGHAYFSLGQYDAAQRYYELYLERPEDELNQWNAAMMAARCCFLRQDWAGCRSWSMAALTITPRYKDPFLFLAHAAWWGENDADTALAWLGKGEDAEMAPVMVFRNPLDYTVNWWDVEYRARGQLGDYAGALECAQKAYAIQPTMKLRETLRYWEEAVRAEKSTAAALQIADHLVRRSDLLRAKQLLHYLLPQTIKKDTRIRAAQQRLEKMLVWVTDAEHQYDEVDNHEITGDLSTLRRVQWYIERLKARGAKKVLEVGCHNGDVTRILHDAGFEMTGIDISPKVLEVAKRLAGDRNIRFECRPLEEVYASGEKYDAVMFAEILEHLPPQKAVHFLNMGEEIAPVVLGSVPAEFLPYGAGLFEEQAIRAHVVEFDQNDLEELILTNPERRIVNCHKVEDDGSFMDSPGFGNRLFEFDHRHGQGPGVSFYLGNAWEPWSPRSINEGGLGGSETTAARLAEALADAGCRVVVYAMEEGVHNGVVYRRYDTFDPKDEREVLVVSRQPWMLNERPNAHTTVLWCHDTQYGELFTPEVAQNTDKIVVLSEWQRRLWQETYPWLDREKLHVINHGIELHDGLERWWGCGVTFAGVYGENADCEYCNGAGCGPGLHVRPIERKRHRFAYTSSADRGLDELLHLWPFIREMWPDAELHVFYGFNYLSAARQRRPELGQYLASVQRLARQPGVFLRGRVGQQQLSEELSKTQFWLYPSMMPDGQGDWFETFCINALEAQAYGAIPLTRPVGALPERVSEMFMIEDWTRDTVLERLQHFDNMPEEELEQFRAGMRKWVALHTWADVGDQWNIMLTKAAEAVAV